MLTSPAAGRFLELLVWATGAKRVLEIGTYTGHSALAMAAALPPGGRVITLELDPDRAAFARRHMDESPYGDRIEIRVGPALESVQALEGRFDLVFIDADKTGYPAYFDATLPLLAERGLIVLDNTLQGGRVLQDDGGEQVEVIKQLNDRLAADERLVTVLLTVRDGMTVVRRAEA
jgi:caffeoyl-CoA O-methyltransferase